VNLIRFYCIILHQMFLAHWYEIIYKLISDLSYLTLYILQFVKYISLNYFYFNTFDVGEHSERYPLNRCQINDLIIHVLLHENWQFLNVVSVKTIVEFITKIISKIISEIMAERPFNKSKLIIKPEIDDDFWFVSKFILDTGLPTKDKTTKTTEFTPSLFLHEFMQR